MCWRWNFGTGRKAVAIRFSASSHSLTVAAPPDGDFTIMAWVLIVVDRNDYSSFFTIGTSISTGFRYLGTDADGTTLLLDAGYITGTGASLNVGQWYHVAMVEDGAGNTVIAYLNGVANIGPLTQTAARQTNTLYAGNNAFSEFLNGRVAYVKAWTAILTESEIQVEMQTIAPRRTANLWGWWPLFPGAAERVVDYSGNGRNWTANGTLNDEDPPPVGWGGAVLLPQRGAGGTTYTQSLAAAVSSSALNALQSSKMLTATQSSSAAPLKQPRSSLVATASSSATSLKQPRPSLAASLSTAATLLKQPRSSSAASLFSSATLLKQPRIVFPAVLSTAAQLIRLPRKQLAASLPSASAISSLRVVVLALAATLPSTAALSRQPRKVLASAVSALASIARRSYKHFTANTAPIAMLSAARLVAMSLTATITSTAVMAMQAKKIVVSSLQPSATIFKRPLLARFATLASSSALERLVIGAAGVIRRAALLVTRGRREYRAEISHERRFVARLHTHALYGAHVHVDPASFDKPPAP